MSRFALFTTPGGGTHKQDATRLAEDARDSYAWICPDKNCGQRLHYRRENIQGGNEITRSAHFFGKHTELCDIGRHEHARNKETLSLKKAIAEKHPIILNLNMNLLEPNSWHQTHIYVPVRPNAKAAVAHAFSDVRPAQPSISTIDDFQEAYNLILQGKAVDRTVVQYFNKDDQKYTIPLDDFVIRGESKKIYRLIETMMAATKDPLFDPSPRSGQRIIAHPVYFAFSPYAPEEKKNKLYSYSQRICGKEQDGRHRNYIRGRYSMAFRSDSIQRDDFLNNGFTVHGIGFPSVFADQLSGLKTTYVNNDKAHFFINLEPPRTLEQVTCNGQEHANPTLYFKDEMPGRPDKTGHRPKPYRD